MVIRGQVQYHQPGHSRAEIVIDAEGVPGRRIDPEYRWETVELADARGSVPAPSFGEHGLCFVEAPCCLQGPESFEPSRAEYERELVELVERELGAREIVVFDHTLRIEGHGYRPPSYHVHCDYNASSASKRMEEQLGTARAEEWLRGRFAVINVWRPLGHAVERSPLGFVLPQSVAAEDWVEVDIVFPHRRGQIRGLAWNAAHRWIHLGGMQPHEAAVFTVYANEGVGGVAHAAVRLDDTPADSRPRQSIESRMVVRWG
jgi:hypothetical protein